jgi:DNA-binding CsgD family transcriptional regulator
LEREAELAAIRAALEAAVAGDGRALSIEGEAGVGKTRLLGEARGIAAAAGAEVLAARAGELERDFPFAVLRQLLGPRLRQASVDELDTLFDGAGPARGALGLSAVGDETSADAFAALHSLYWVVAALAERSPLLLAIDDAHLADAASLDWLGFMLPRLDEMPVCIVLARRTDEAQNPGLARIVGDQSVEAILPSPLSAEATATLIGEALRQPADPSFSAVCHEITGGNPFLLTELGRELADQSIDPRAGSSELARDLAPQRVAQTVLSRISRLPSEAAALARAVAILGDGCEPMLAGRLSGLDLEAGRQAADSLRAAAILDLGESLRFIHPLVRNAVYADLATGERGAAHATAAALLREGGASPERVAVQLLAGEPREDALAAETLLEAGRGALADGAPRSAAAFLNRALQEPPASGLRLDVLRPLLAACIRSADHETLTAIEPELRAAIERDPAGTRDLAVDLPGGLTLSGRFEEAGEILSAAVGAAAEEGDMDSAFKLDSALRTIGMVLPSVKEVDLRQYMGQIEPDSPAERLAAAVEARARVIDESRPAAIKAAGRALSNDCSLFEEEPEMISATGSVLILVIADEMDAAAAAAQRALEIARKRNSTPEIGRAWFLRGLVWLGYGDLVAAESDLRQAREIARLAAIPPLWFTAAGPLALILIWRDELEAAESILTESGVATGPMPPGSLFLMQLISRAKLRFERGDPKGCLEDIRALSDQSDAFGGGPGPALMLGVDEIRCLVAAGRTDEARKRADTLLGHARRWGAPATVSHLLRGVAAAAEGAAKIEFLKEAVAVSAESPRRLQFAEAAVDLGASLRRQNQRAAAREPLREGLKVARQCGAIRLAKYAHQELRATGETVRRYAPIGVESLTPSERRVAKLAASGMTNRQIAQSLFVTLKTVEAHLSAAYDKLDIGSRRELAGALDGGVTGA